ncbi:MAG: Gfo/Idh/MocA family oxidoreductase [Clostridia bacterium]|nr:Gfo/Idh/MocA family oxidoreductase [Clostridia bacterium]
MEKVKLGIIGLGQRGYQIAETIANCVQEIDIVAVSDSFQDRVDQTLNMIKEKRGCVAVQYKDYHDMLLDDNVDAVFVATGWESHVGVSIECMRANKATAMEVGGAYNLEELWELVNVWEETKVPFMFMENCCFGEYELMATNMVRQGVLGKISHCSGAYAHDLREEIAKSRDKVHYRRQNYIDRNCENYPTHELGPIAKILGINRGNRMTKLVSVSSIAQGFHEYVVECDEADKSLLDVEFKQGDIVNTLITCEDGRTIALKLDTALPRFYSREFSVHGTKGLYSELAHAVFIEGCGNHWDTRSFLGNDTSFLDKYSTKMWQALTPEDRESGHGGMDLFELKAFAKALINNEDMPIDVYDAASWMAITCLSEESIKNGVQMEIPDFTRGKYKNRPLKDVIDWEKERL